MPFSSNGTTEDKEVIFGGMFVHHVVCYLLRYKRSVRPVLNEIRTLSYLKRFACCSGIEPSTLVLICLVIESLLATRMEG